MKTLRNSTAILALAALAAVPGTARPASFKHELSIYQDDKEGALQLPEGVACSDKGALVVADTGNGRLLVYAFREGKLSGGTEVKIAEAARPVRVQIDAKGEVLVLDRRSRRIVRVDAAGKFAGAIEWKGASGSAAVMPTAFKLDASGNLHVLDVASRRVLVADPGGRVSREIPLPGAGTEFTDVAVDGTGRILAVDSVGSRVWVADRGAKEFKPLGTSLKDRVSFPVYLLEDHGKMYLVDQNGNGIALLGSDGEFLGRELEMGWVNGRVYYPAQMCVNGEGLAFVADRNNNRVQVFSLAR
ncbi:MAG: NHL repeat-containing protein [Deltaproteobacteria bacterium]